MISPNTERANRADLALLAYSGISDECNLRDLLCDLRHLADRTGQDWNDQLRMAMDNYRAELAEDGTDADRAKGADTPTPLTQASENLIDQLAVLRIQVEKPYLIPPSGREPILRQLDEIGTTAEAIHTIHLQEQI